MMPPPLKRLPPELEDRVIDFCEDRQTLWACSLVCRAWLNASQYHLFRSITLLSVQRLIKFVHVICYKPLLGQHIRFLHISFPTIPNNFAEIVPAIPNIAPLLDDLVIKHTAVMLDGGADKILRHGMFLDVKSLALVNVWFQYFSQLKSLVGALPKLSQLRLANISWSRDAPFQAGDAVPLGQSNARLRHLQLSFHGRFLRPLLEWLSESPVLENLPRLTVHIDSLSTAGVFNDSFIRRWAATVQHLELEVGPLIFPGPDTTELISGIHLEEFTNIQTLRLSPSISGPISSEKWIVEALERLAPSVQLKSLYLTFVPFHPSEWLHRMNFEILHDSLSSPRLCFLECVDFQIPKAFWDQIRPAILEKFYDFMQRGMIQFSEPVMDV